MAFVLAEDERVVFVEQVVVRGKAGVDRRELLRLRVVQLNLPVARAWHREVLGELVRRAVLAERRLLLRSANPCRDPHASLGVHRHAAGVGLPLPDLLVPPHRRARGVGIEHRPVRRNLDLRRRVLLRIEHGENVGASGWPRRSARSRSALECARRCQPHRSVCWSAAPSPTSRSRGCARHRWDAAALRDTRRRRSDRSNRRTPCAAAPRRLKTPPMFAPLGPIVMWLIPRLEASRQTSQRPSSIHASHGCRPDGTRSTPWFRGQRLGRVFAFGDLQQAQPVICRIDLRGGASVRRDDRFEVETLSKAWRGPAPNPPTRSPARTPRSSLAADPAGRSAPDRR